MSFECFVLEFFWRGRKKTWINVSHMRTGALLVFRIIMGTLKKRKLNALLVNERKLKQFITKLLDQPINALLSHAPSAHV